MCHHEVFGNLWAGDDNKELIAKPNGIEIAKSFRPSVEGELWVLCQKWEGSWWISQCVTLLYLSLMRIQENCLTKDWQVLGSIRDHVSCSIIQFCERLLLLSFGHDEPYKECGYTQAEKRAVHEAEAVGKD